MGQYQYEMSLNDQASSDQILQLNTCLCVLTLTLTEMSAYKSLNAYCIIYIYTYYGNFVQPFSNMSMKCGKQSLPHVHSFS